MNTLNLIVIFVVGLGIGRSLAMLPVGTRSLLFGVHCFFIHPWFVAAGWWKLYGFPYDPRLWIAFIVHDWGYWWKPNMDGPEGEQHPHVGANIMWWMFRRQRCRYGNTWYNFSLYHSRYLAKLDGYDPSKLCHADKMAFVLTPRWFYLIQANLSGELEEYMRGQGCRTPAGERGQWKWLTDCQNYVRTWVMEHKDGRPDKWTGTVRDHARELEETRC